MRNLGTGVKRRARELAAGFNQFGLDLQRLLPERENTFFSPLSIGLALAALRMGARGRTAGQMDEVLHVRPAPDHPQGAVADLRAALAPRTEASPEWDEDGTMRHTEVDVFRLSVATALFVEEAYPLHTAYCDELSETLAADFFSDPFTDPEAAAERINGWVSEGTEGRITRIVTDEMLRPAPKLVLANAVYFNARWLQPFSTWSTTPKPFELADGESVEVEAMHAQEDYALWEDEELGARALGIPYEQGLSMLVVLPEPGRTEAVARALTAELLARIGSEARRRLVDLQIPKVELRFDALLREHLRALGMPDAFEPLTADFGAITPRPEGLVVSEVIHQAWVRIDEEGTEAAAATVAAVLAGAAAIDEEPPEPVPFVVDRPYFFFIRDEWTGAVLFMGRVVDPRP